jgi:hypothetical protein
MGKKPTTKQYKAVLDTLENLRREKPKTKQQILLDAGYSPNVAVQPTIVTESKGFKELLNEAIPDSELIRVGKEGLNATTIRFTPEGEMIEVDDYATRHKYWKELHVHKGYSAPEQEGPKQQTINNFFYKPEITAKTKEFEDQLKDLLAE